MKELVLQKELFPSDVISEEEWRTIESNDHFFSYSRYNYSFYGGFRYIQKGDSAGDIECGYYDRSKPSYYSPYTIVSYKTTLYAPFTGFIYYKYNKELCLGDTLYTLYTEEEFLETFKNEYEIQDDQLLGGKEIVWKYTPFSRTGRFQIANCFGLTFLYRDGKAVVGVHYDKSKIKPKRKDQVIFIFEDDITLSFLIEQPIHKIDKDENRFFLTLTKEDVEVFSSHMPLKLRFNFQNGTPAFIVENSFHKGYLGQFYYKHYLIAYNKALIDCGIKWEEEKPEEVVSTTYEPCYVYLMVDTANGYHKIGISNKPEYREGTLQSEKPTIELLCAKEFPSRTIARAIESALHSTYEDKHIRGEWFKLNANDIIELMATLK